jgi:hypothetical protein
MITTSVSELQERKAASLMSYTHRFLEARTLQILRGMSMPVWSLPTAIEIDLRRMLRENGSPRKRPIHPGRVVSLAVQPALAQLQDLQARVEALEARLHQNSTCDLQKYQIPSCSLLLKEKSRIAHQDT